MQLDTIWRLSLPAVKDHAISAPRLPHGEPCLLRVMHEACLCPLNFSLEREACGTNDEAVRKEKTGAEELPERLR
jgi:hypothetical protein